jgi:hypothetical protein
MSRTPPHRLGDQSTRAGSQYFSEWIVDCPFLSKGNNSILSHGVTLLLGGSDGLITNPVTPPSSQRHPVSSIAHLRAPGASVPDGRTIRRKLVARSRVFGAGSLIPVTNAIESLNAKLRRAVRTRGHFPTDEAAIKLLYLVLRQVAQTWKMPPREWCEAKTHFAIMFDDRLVKA